MRRRSRRGCSEGLRSRVLGYPHDWVYAHVEKDTILVIRFRDGRGMRRLTEQLGEKDAELVSEEVAGSGVDRGLLIPVGGGVGGSSGV